MNNIKIKTFGFKLDDVDPEGTFTGYLSVFDVEDSYGDVVRSGAFKKTLKEQKRFPLLNYHDPEQVIGDFEGTEDDRGLKIKGRLLLDIQKAKEKYVAMKAGVLKGLSIGYETVKDLWDRDTNIRELLELKLWEGSLVTFGANSLALVDEVKSSEQFEHVMRLLDALRKKDLSDNEKEMVYKANKGFNALLDGWEPLPEIGTIGPIDDDTPGPKKKSQDKSDEPELLHSLSQLNSELEALKSTIGGSS